MCAENTHKGYKRLRRICQDRMGQKHFATVPLKIQSLQKLQHIFKLLPLLEKVLIALEQQYIPCRISAVLYCTTVKKICIQITFYFGALYSVYIANDIMLVFHICRKCFYRPSAKNTDALNVCTVSFFGSVNDIITLGFIARPSYLWPIGKIQRWNKKFCLSVNFFYFGIP